MTAGSGTDDFFDPWWNWRVGWYAIYKRRRRVADHPVIARTAPQPAVTPGLQLPTPRACLIATVVLVALVVAGNVVGDDDGYSAWQRSEDARLEAACGVPPDSSTDAYWSWSACAEAHPPAS